MQLLLAFTVFCAASLTQISQAYHVQVVQENRGNAQKWDSLKVTWSPNPFSSSAFVSMPRSVESGSQMKGFVRKDDFCNGEQPKGPFAGVRYWKNSDPAVMLIFDVNGIIAGIQTAVPKADFTPMSGPTVGHPWIDDGVYWTLTTYFVDPSIICHVGRTKEDLKTQGTGTGLYILNGTDSTNDLLHINSDEKQILTGTNWKYGHCFYTMGNHYWYNVRKDMPCNEAFPLFLMYNKKNLNGFGFAINAGLTSPRYEHPSHAIIGKFMNPVPDCINTEPAFARLSTMHVFFTGVLGNRC